ncbi:molecular chaperone DnaK [Burkholderia mayonis]|uniref:Molecular chaperone DnaK n=1 Tax=Burkholderia mayonis TaxID=1385591 RepID=A0A1B4FLU7_9BURK|nr:Hsp70 family protein [Burkholderia mayonis]AOJ04636.1 molecular chaperone DnaK [Burkholderia mayonis]KVE48322.1 molecular chaperone DnaK [Burkholderia mayonis]
MKPFIVGIDLGTSNTVVAYVETGGDAIRVFDVDQLVAPGEVGARPLLPSARYHPAAGEFAPGDLRLPWRDAEGSEAVGAPPPAVIGTLARSLGAQVPGRLVASAKSWLSHASVDRLAPILPWGATDANGKVSPVAASASYLAHVRAAWNSRFPDARLEDQDVVLTVPASFDDGASALTLEAARIAQLPALRLLEEPQAAFYDWLFHHRTTLRESLEQTRLVLVCDVGGGTTDLTLIKVHVEDGEPQLTRIGVGDHLMLGGDNMDLALARLAETRLTQDDARLSAASLSQLVERCRTAKERLLDAAPPDTVGVTLLGSGARLVGGARKTELSREEVERIVVDGFFPASGPDDLPRKPRAALVEFGLPYAADPAVTRHIAAFLHRLAAQSRDALGAPDAANPTLPIPDTLLLNGGVFRSKALADRLADVLGDWRRQPLHVLQNDHPDVAVARGAVAYGLARAGQAPRIGGGSPRSYFLVVDDDAQASRGVCVLPRGTAEGHEVHLDDRVFVLRLGHPVRFHLASTVADNAWRPGELVDLAAGDFVRLPPVATVVQQQDAGGSRERRVKLTTSLTEVGTLDMHCIATDDPSQRWLLEFQLRRERAEDGAADAPSHPSLDKAVELIDRSFGARLANVDPKEVRRLRAQLEQLLGPRENWDIALLRELFGALWARVGRRRRSADHERVWLNLAGYCVRPGFGYPLDDWRVAQLWTLFDDGIQYVNEGRVWSEWWTLWRRAAGGLVEEAQRQALDAMAWLQEAAGAKRPKLPFDPAKIGDMDMVRLAASLERVAIDRKIDLGERLLARLQRPTENHQCWWAIGRIGARRPLYGSAHGVVPPDVASRWLDAILAVDWKKVEPAAFAAVQIARMTGDRSNDLTLDVRDKVVRRLASVNAPAAWSQMVREVVTLDNADTGRAFGESLPAGLKLVKLVAG